MATTTTYRHEFSKTFIEALSKFSKVHQYDDRHTYKSEWTKWTQQENIAEAIELEKRRLTNNGYVGNIDDKMFKAGRYYFRKKSTGKKQQQQEENNNVNDNNNNDDNDDNNDNDEDKPSSATTATTPRRTYISMSKTCIKMMDEHIRSTITTPPPPESPSPSMGGIPPKPSICYDEFFKTKMSSDEMTKEIGNIVEKLKKSNSVFTTSEEITAEIMDKIKKTYKNRYYKLTGRKNNQ
jgi:hypothetical protein